MTNFDEQSVAENADSLIDEGRFTEAIAVLTEALESIRPQRQHLSYLELATNLRLLEEANSVAMRNPDCADVLIFQARLLLQAGSTRPAMKVLADALNAVNLDTHTLIMIQKFRIECALVVGDLGVLEEVLSWLAEDVDSENDLMQRRGAVHEFVRAVSATSSTENMTLLEDLGTKAAIVRKLPNVAALLRAKAEELRLLSVALDAP